MAEQAKTSKERQSKQTRRKSNTRTNVKTHSERFLKLEEKLAKQGSVNLADAIARIKETATTKFDSSIELHLHLNAKKGKKGAENEYARGLLSLPHGLGKSRKVVVLTEELVEELAKTQKINFDIAIATPSLMPKLGKVAKLLGTKGKMPNPRSGTVTDNPEAAKAAIEAGRVEYRQDAGRNIHQMIGKASWETEKLVENAQIVMNAFTRNRVASMSLTSTMGPSIKVNLTD